MHPKHQFRDLAFCSISRLTKPALAFVILLVFMGVLTIPALTQTYKVIHYFTSGADGAFPYDGLAVGEHGELYGTTRFGGGGNCSYHSQVGCGMVFKLTPSPTGWILNPLYVFKGSPDGAWPGRIIIGPDHSLYGTTEWGGEGEGVVFKLQPPPASCIGTHCHWTETVLYTFKLTVGVTGGSVLSFDQAGNLYGTSYFGGPHGFGAVYKLSPHGAGWTETEFYFVDDGEIGVGPKGGVIVDSVGDLYGTTSELSTIFQLIPSGNAWTKQVLHRFALGEGDEPHGNLTFDGMGNLYGVNFNGGVDGGGTIFKLTPSAANGGFWVLHQMPRNTDPNGNLVMDAAGNLYGTTYYGGSRLAGTVFKLSPTGNDWTYTSLHDFGWPYPSEGLTPSDGVVLRPDGRIYGTTPSGGLPLCRDAVGVPGCGVVFEITP